MQLHLVLTASLWSILLWRKDGISSAAEPGYLDFDNLPETNFSCENKVIGGYYADIETGCQMFHVCTIGQKGEITDIKFLCLNGTVFDQETRVCERLDEVDCSKSESFFDLNLELYGNKAHGFGGIEPESEDIIEEECNPEVDEDCQKLDESDGDDGSYDNDQQTTYAPILQQQSTTTKRPQPTVAPPLPSPPQHQHHHHRQHFHHHTGHGHLPSQTSPSRTPTPPPRPLSTTTSLPLTTTATAIPATTILPQVVQYQSSSPETIAALLALHNAFQQSLQLHDLDGDDADDIDSREQQRQQQQDIRKEQPNNSNNNNNNNRQGLFYQQTQTTKQPSLYQFQQQPTQQTLPRPPQLNHHFPLQQRPPTQQQQQSQVYQPSQSSTRFGNHFNQQQQQRFQSQNYQQQQQQQQNRNQQVSLQPPPQTERPKPFSYHQQQQFDQDSTPSPYLLHQLKVNRVKEEQQQLQHQLQHGTFVRQTSHRSLASPSAIAVVTSTSTTTSVRSGNPTGNQNNNGNNKQQKSTSRHILNNHPHSISASFPTIINSNENNNNNTEHVPPSSYDEYQEGDVRSDPFFRDVPKIGRKRRHVHKSLMKIKRNKRSVYDSLMKYQTLYLNLMKNKILKRDLTKHNSTTNLNSSNNINLSKTMLAVNKRLINNKKFLKKTNENNLINEKLDDSKIITYIDGKRIDDRKYVSQSNLNNKENGTSAINSRKDVILLDNLELSPEERNFFNEISAVISKYIIPPRTPVGSTYYNNINNINNSKIVYNIQNNLTNNTDNLSARDRFRLNLFVTLRENFKNKSNFKKKRKRKKRSETASKSEKDNNKEHHYEVSEVVDEPTTILPFISFLSRLRPINVHNDHNLNLETKISDASRSLKSISDNNSSTNRRTFSKVKSTKNESTTEKSIENSTTEESSPRISSENFNIKRRHRLLTTTENILTSDETFAQASSENSLPKQRLTNKTKIPTTEEDIIVNTLKPTIPTATNRLTKKRNRLISPQRNFERFEASQLSDNNQEITVSPISNPHRMTVVNKKQITSTDTPDKLTTVMLLRRKKLLSVQRNKLNDTEPIKITDSLTSSTNIHHRRASVTIEPEVSTTPIPRKTLNTRNTARRNLYEVNEATTIFIPSTLSRRRDFNNRSNRRRNDDNISSTTVEYSTERITNRKSKSNGRRTSIEESTTPFTATHTTSSRQRTRNNQSSRNKNVEDVNNLQSSARNLENTGNGRERSFRRRYSTTTSSSLEVDNSSPLSRNRKKNNNYEITSTTASTLSTTLKLNNANDNGTFTCDGKIKGGFYADMESDCRGFFICSEPALPQEPLVKTHFWCGEATKFNQRSRTCQADYLVECSISPRYYSLNDNFFIPSEEKDSFEPKKL